MFSFITKIFKKIKCEPDFAIIKIDYSLLKKKKDVLGYEDVYKKIGVWNYILQLIEVNKFKKFHYKNIQANMNTYKKLQEILRDNLLHTHNKFSRMYKEKYILSMQAWDSLQWSPYTNETIQDDEIKIILPNNPEFVNVTKEMI